MPPRLEIRYTLNQGTMVANSVGLAFLDSHAMTKPRIEYQKTHLQIPVPSRFDFNNAHARWLRGLALHHHFGRREEAKMECERAVECARMQGVGLGKHPAESTLGCSAACT